MLVEIGPRAAPLHHQRFAPQGRSVKNQCYTALQSFALVEPGKHGADCNGETYRQ